LKFNSFHKYGTFTKKRRTPCYPAERHIEEASRDWEKACMGCPSSLRIIASRRGAPRQKSFSGIGGEIVLARHYKRKDP
jgi:hypothetical protein